MISDSYTGVVGSVPGMQCEGTHCLEERCEVCVGGEGASTVMAELGVGETGIWSPIPGNRSWDVGERSANFAELLDLAAKGPDDFQAGPPRS